MTTYTIIECFYFFFVSHSSFIIRVSSSKSPNQYTFIIQQHVVKFILVEK